MVGITEMRGHIKRYTLPKAKKRKGNCRVYCTPKCSNIWKGLWQKTENAKLKSKNRIWITKEAFRNLSKIVRKRIFSLETKKGLFNTYVISILLYIRACWIISSQLMKLLTATERWFYRTMLRISWTSKSEQMTML